MRHFRSCLPDRGRAGAATSADGFTLVEMVVALAILAIVLPAFAEAFLSGVFSTSDARLKEAAITLAESAVDNARAVTPSSYLLNGNAASNPPAQVDLSNTLSPVQQTPKTTTLDNHVFTTTTYAGRCYLQSNGQCTTTSSASPMIRVIAAVAWSTPTGCTGGTCYYVASSLISNSSDPTLETNPNAVPTPPYNVTVVTPGSKHAVVGWSAPYSPLPITKYTATASPGGASCTTSVGVTCTITTSSTGAYTFTVTATSSSGTSPASSPAVSATVR